MSTSDSLDNAKRWPCLTCNKTFGRKEHLQRHEDTLHRALTQYVCEQCKKSFARKDIFSRHMKKIHNQHSSSYSPTSGSALNSNISPVSPSPSTSTRGKRSQAALDRSKRACKRCSRLKMRCDGQQPCQRCSNDVRLNNSCDYSLAIPNSGGSNIIDSNQITIQTHSQTSLQQSDTIQPFSEPDGIMALASAALPEGVYHQADRSNFENAPIHESHDLDRIMVFDEGEIHPSLFDDLLDKSSGIFSWLFAGYPSDFTGAETTIPPVMDHNHENMDINVEGNRAQSYNPTAIQSNHSDGEEGSSGQSSTGNLVWPNARASETLTQELTIVPFSIKGADEAILSFENTYQVLQVQNGIQERMINLVELSDLSTDEKVHAKAMLEGTSTIAVNAFVQLYFEHYDQLCPIVHRPTFDPNSCHPFLLSAICAIGAMYSAIPKADLFAKNLMVLVNRTWFANFAKQSRNMANIQLMQTLLLNINFFRSSGNRRMLELAESARSPLTTMIRRSKLLDKSTTEEISFSGHQQEDERDWHRWVEFEKGRRLAWLFFICDIELSAVWNLPPCFGLHELKAQLPCDERSWRATGRSTWMRLRASRMPIYINGLIEEPRVRDVQDNNITGIHTRLQKGILACTLCSLGLALGNVRASPLYFITIEANQHYVDLCSTFVIKEKAEKLSVQRPSNDFAEMLVRFTLIRHKIDIIDLQLLTGGAARHADTSLALERIKQSFLGISNSGIDRLGLMAHIIHCGRIVYLYRFRPIDSTYADCILFYAISSLYAFSCLWTDILSVLHHSSSTEDQGGKSELCIDGESFIDVGHNLDILTCRLTMKGVGCITLPDSPTKIMAVCAEELLVRPSGTSWPIGKLIGHIAKEIGTVDSQNSKRPHSMR